MANENVAHQIDIGEPIGLCRYTVQGDADKLWEEGSNLHECGVAIIESVIDDLACGKSFTESQRLLSNVSFGAKHMLELGSSLMAGSVKMLDRAAGAQT